MNTIKKEDKKIKEAFSQSTKLTTTVIILAALFVALIIFIFIMNIRKRGGLFTSMIRPVFSFRPLNMLPQGVQGEVKQFTHHAKKYKDQFDKHINDFNNLSEQAQAHIHNTLDSNRYGKELRQHISGQNPHINNNAPTKVLYRAPKRRLYKAPQQQN